GDARTTASVAILLLAPARFSTTNDCPSRSDSACPVKSRDDVGCSAGAEAFDQVHRPGRIIERARKTRCGWQRGGTRCQMQEFAAGKFHLEPPFTSFDHLVGGYEEAYRAP